MNATRYVAVSEHPSGVLCVRKDGSHFLLDVLPDKREAGIEYIEVIKAREPYGFTVEEYLNSPLHNLPKE